MQQLNIFLICLLSFCLTSFLVIGQNVKVQVINTDPRGIIVQGESAILHIGLSQAKNNYIIYVKINGKIVYRLKNGKPEARFNYYPSTAKTGKYLFNLQVQYLVQGVLKNAQLVYNYEVIKPTRTLVRRFFLRYPNKIPAYRNTRGKPIKVQFRGDTSRVKIYQGTHKTYLIPYQVKAHVLEVYHQGRKIDQIQFQVMALPSPSIQLSYARDSTKLSFAKSDSAKVLITLKESPITSLLLNGKSRNFLVKSFELTYFGRTFTGKYATSTVKMSGNIYRFDQLLRSIGKTYINGRLVEVKKTQSGDLMLVKVLEVSQLFSLPSKGKNMKIPLPGYVQRMEYKLK